MTLSFSGGFSLLGFFFSAACRSHAARSRLYCSTRAVALSYTCLNACTSGSYSDNAGMSDYGNGATYGGFLPDLRGRHCADTGPNGFISSDFAHVHFLLCLHLSLHAPGMYRCLRCGRYCRCFTNESCYYRLQDRVHSIYHSVYVCLRSESALARRYPYCPYHYGYGSGWLYADLVRNATHGFFLFGKLAGKHFADSCVTVPDYARCDNRRDWPCSWCSSYFQRC